MDAGESIGPTETLGYQLRTDDLAIAHNPGFHAALLEKMPAAPVANEVKQPRRTAVISVKRMDVFQTECTLNLLLTLLRTRTSLHERSDQTQMQRHQAYVNSLDADKRNDDAAHAVDSRNKTDQQRNQNKDGLRRV